MPHCFSSSSSCPCNAFTEVVQDLVVKQMYHEGFASLLFKVQGDDCKCGLDLLLWVACRAYLGVTLHHPSSDGAAWYEGSAQASLVCPIDLAECSAAHFLFICRTSPGIHLSLFFFKCCQLLKEPWAQFASALIT